MQIFDTSLSRSEFSKITRVQKIARVLFTDCYFSILHIRWSKLIVRTSLWDTKANKASGKSLESQRINEKLENIKTNISKQYQRLCDRDAYVTAEKIRNAFLGMGEDCLI